MNPVLCSCLLKWVMWGCQGCSGFAAACVKAGSLEGKMCPVGGQPTMEKVASILGLEAAESVYLFFHKPEKIQEDNAQAGAGNENT